MADAYAKRYMGGDAAIVSTRAQTAPWANIAQAILFGTLMLEGVVAHRAMIPAFLLAGIVLAVWLTGMVVRSTLTSTHLHVQHGFFGPKIAIEEIEDVSVESVTARHWAMAFGWGIGGLGLDGRAAYLVFGFERALVVRYRRNGKSKTALVSMRDPEKMRVAIERLREPLFRVDGSAAIRLEEFLEDREDGDVTDEIERARGA